MVDGVLLYDIRYEGFEGNDALESKKHGDELATPEDFEVEVRAVYTLLS